MSNIPCTRICRMKTFFSTLLSQLRIPSEREIKDLQLNQIREALEMKKPVERAEKIDDLYDVEQLRQTDVAVKGKSFVENPVETISDVSMRRNDIYVVGRLN